MYKALAREGARSCYVVARHRPCHFGGLLCVILGDFCWLARNSKDERDKERVDR
jgi:hypothetical protein